ncbi:MAG: hypothetical protein KDA24_10040 [Deltaproteobacteria bacterium]|nr:hypothetical protein [Deltaproteobacteria bacterium]
MPLTPSEREHIAALMTRDKEAGAQPRFTGAWFLHNADGDFEGVAGELRRWRAAKPFLEKAPRLVGTYGAKLQTAINNGETDDVRAILIEASAYLRKLHEELTAIRDRSDADEYAELFSLQASMKEVRSADPVLLRALVRDTETLVRQAVREVEQMARFAWWQDLPQRAAAQAPLAEVTDEYLASLSEEFVARAEEIGAELSRRAAAGETAGRPLRAAADLDRLAAGRAPADVGATPCDRGSLEWTHASYEWLAHCFAYEPARSDTNHVLLRNGYSSKTLNIEHPSGANFVVVMPHEGQMLPPLFVFRGTQPEDLRDVYTDVQLQIGDLHFRALERLGLGAMLRAACPAGRPRAVLTGHSLGGALAQLATAAWPEFVGECVTFQSPGLMRLHHRRGCANLETVSPSPRVTHYVADADIVHRAGARHLPGETIAVTGLRVDVEDELQWGLGHTDLLLVDHAMRDNLVDLQLAAIWRPHRKHWFFELAEHPTARGSGHELGRSLLAIGVELGRFALDGPRPTPEPLSWLDDGGARPPGSVLHAARHLASRALDQQTRPSLVRALVELSSEGARAAVRSAMRFPRRR